MCNGDGCGAAYYAAWVGVSWSILHYRILLSGSRKSRHADLNLAGVPDLSGRVSHIDGRQSASHAPLERSHAFLVTTELHSVSTGLGGMLSLPTVREKQRVPAP
jgi:hypothetical protein